MPVMPNTIPTFPKGSRGRDQSFCTRLPCLCSPDQIPTPLHPEMAPLGPAGFQQQWLQGQLCPTLHSQDRAMKSLSSVLRQIPKPVQTQLHTHLLPCLSLLRSHFPSCCQILPTIQPQHWFPSRNNSLPRAISFLCFFKMSVMTEQQRGTEGRKLPCNDNCKQSTSCFPQKTGNDVGSRRKWRAQKTMNKHQNPAQFHLKESTNF